MSGIFDEFGGSLTANVISFDQDAIPAPDTLVICMKRGERRIADDLRKAFGGFMRVVVDVDGEQHEFHADSLIQMLEDYEDAQGMNNHMRLFGTPERAARTVTALETCRVVSCEECVASGVCKYQCDYDFDYDAMLEWLRGRNE